MAIPENDLQVEIVEGSGVIRLTLFGDYERTTWIDLTDAQAELLGDAMPGSRAHSRQGACFMRCSWNIWTPDGRSLLGSYPASSAQAAVERLTRDVPERHGQSFYVARNGEPWHTGAYIQAEDGQGMTLEARLADLQAHGCYPSLYRRGKVWRAHVNTAGNMWADAPTPHEALEKAVRKWKTKGCKMDGFAAEGARP